MSAKTYRDKFGRIIEEFDLLKVFHFVGARRKRYYMYKHVRRNTRGDLACFHMTGEDPNNIDAWFNLSALPEDTEIIQSKNYEKLDHKEKKSE